MLHKKHGNQPITIGFQTQRNFIVNAYALHSSILQLFRKCWAICSFVIDDVHEYEFSHSTNKNLDYIFSPKLKIE